METITVLHIEDDPDIRVIVEIALSLDPGILVHSVADGAAALAMIAANAAFTPDLLLSDYLLPDMDGTALADRLKAIARVAATPLVFLTALAGQADQDRLRAAGAAGVVTKPFDPIGLSAELRRILQAHGERPA